jgi:hypothetical protein
MTSHNKREIYEFISRSKLSCSRSLVKQKLNGEITNLKFQFISFLFVFAIKKTLFFFFSLFFFQIWIIFSLNFHFQGSIMEHERRGRWKKRHNWIKCWFCGVLFHSIFHQQKGNMSENMRYFFFMYISNKSGLDSDKLHCVYFWASSIKINQKELTLKT